MNLVLGIFLALLTLNICFAGSWATGAFDNDDALDWIQECTASKGSVVIASTLQAALEPGAIEAPTGAMAVAAAEVVATAKGKPHEALPKELGTGLAASLDKRLQNLHQLREMLLARLRIQKRQS